MEKKATIATLVSFIKMSGPATLTDPATNAVAVGTIASFIGHMKSVIETSNRRYQRIKYALKLSIM